MLRMPIFRGLEGCSCFMIFFEKKWSGDVFFFVFLRVYVALFDVSRALFPFVNMMWFL